MPRKEGLLSRVGRILNPKKSTRCKRANSTPEPDTRQEEILISPESTRYRSYISENDPIENFPILAHPSNNPAIYSEDLPQQHEHPPFPQQAPAPSVQPAKNWWQLIRRIRPERRCRSRRVNDDIILTGERVFDPDETIISIPGDYLRHEDDNGVDITYPVSPCHCEESIPVIPFREDDSPVMWPVVSRDLLISMLPAGRNETFNNKSIAHTQVDYQHCLVPDLSSIAACPYYWGEMDRYAAETLLQNKPDGSFLLRDSAQDGYIFSVSFRRYSRSLHARIEQLNNRFSFDSHDNGVFSAISVTKLIEHYKDPNKCLFFEPMLTLPINRTNTFSLQHLCRATICNKVNNEYDSLNHLALPKPLLDYLRYYHYKKTVCVRVLKQV